MPQVPIYNGQQVRQQALEGGLQRAPDVSSDLMRAGQGLTSLGAAAGHLAETEARTKADQIDATITTEWMKWDAENRNKFRGQNADAYAPAAQEWWKNAAETYGKDLDPRAKQLASGTLTRKQGTAMANVAQFTGAEKERHADDTASASITSTIQFGVTTGDVAGAAEQVRGQVAAMGARKGWTTEQVQAEQLKNLSALHLAQITKLASLDATKAQEYYQANKAEVGAQNQPRIEEVLKGEGDNQFAMKFAADNAAKPLAEQLKLAGEVTDPMRREKVIKEVKLNHAAVREAEAEKERQASDQAWQMVGQGKRVPEAVLSQMDGKGRVQLQEHLQARAERLAKGTPVKTDPKTYIDLRERLARGEQVDLRSYTEKLGQQDIERLLDLQTAKPKDSKQDSMISDHERINSALVGLGIDQHKKPEAAKPIIDEIDRRIRATSAAKGDKQLTPEEKQKVVDSVVLDKVYTGTFFKSEKLVSQLKPEDMGDAYVMVDDKQVKLSSVPMVDRRQIIEALKKTGQAVTEQNIATLYVKAKKGSTQ